MRRAMGGPICAMQAKIDMAIVGNLQHFGGPPVCASLWLLLVSAISISAGASVAASRCRGAGLHSRVSELESDGPAASEWASLEDLGEDL